MRNLKIAILIVLLAAGVTACNDDLNDLKVDELNEVMLDDTGGSESGGGSPACPDCRGVN